MPSTTRTFVALPIPAERATRLTRLQQEIMPELPEARWVVPGLMHVTVAFLGNVADAQMDRVCRAVAEGVAGFDPFTLRLDGLGVFPDSRRPRTVWVGLAG